MAKQLKSIPVSVGDLVEYLDNHSDFAFEIKVLNSLIASGFTCEHGGTYDDPVTNKPREFDIRATRTFEKRFLRLAVECKNLRTNFPLHISCLPRRDEEAFHEIAYSVNPETNPIEEPPEPFCVAMLPQSKGIRMTGTQSLYHAGEPVGKSCEQVGRASNDEITASDSDVFDKWSQALSSAHDLTYLACSDGNERTGDVALSLVIPIVVVPDGRLWVTQFDKDGNRNTDPQLADRCSYFVSRSYFHRSASGGDDLTLSHLEFLTISGVDAFIRSLCGTNEQVEATFPAERIFQCLYEQIGV